MNSWMCQNFLQFNKEKTEVIAFGNKDEVLKVNAYLDSRGQTTKNQVRNLGLILETDLSFSSHVKAVTKSAYYHLKNIARIRCFVSSQDLEKLVHAFMLIEYKPNRPLRSVGSSQLEIPRVHTKQGESAFSYFAACSWNLLPEEIRCAKTFKSRLKTHLQTRFQKSWDTVQIVNKKGMQ